VAKAILGLSTPAQRRGLWDGGLPVRIYDEPWAPTPEEEARAETRREMRTVLTAIAVIVLIVGGLLAGRVLAASMMGQCSPGWLTGADPQLCVNAAVTQNNLVVTGTTSLPDGAIIEISVEESVGVRYWSSGTVDVTAAGGSFGRTFDVSSWSSGTAIVTARFAVTVDQPQAIIDRYHADGSGLSGPDVRPGYRGGGSAVVEMTTQVYVGE
jgi:hypothetical protein